MLRSLIEPHVTARLGAKERRGLLLQESHYWMQVLRESRITEIHPTARVLYTVPQPEALAAVCTICTSSPSGVLFLFSAFICSFSCLIAFVLFGSGFQSFSRYFSPSEPLPSFVPFGIFLSNLSDTRYKKQLTNSP